MSTEQILINLRMAREILSSVENEKITLDYFRFEHKTCGTLACGVGWLAMSPQFQGIVKLMQANNQQWVIAPVNATEVPECQPGRGYDFTWLDEHFGPRAFDLMFSCREDLSPYDEQYPAAEYSEDGDLEVHVTDKDLALWRIDQQINALIKEQHV